MKTLIVYASSHGTTEKVAEKIAAKLGNKTDVINLKKQKHIDVESYDRIIIGGSVHAGQLQKRVKKFCAQNMVTLLQKKVGLFLSCMDDNKAQEQFNRAFPEVLRSHAISKKTTGGEFCMEKMNFIERAIVKKVAGITDSVQNLKEDKIEELVSEISA